MLTLRNPVRLALSGAAGQQHGWSKGLTSRFRCEQQSYGLSAAEVQRTACQQHWEWLQVLKVEGVTMVGLVYETHLASNVHHGLQLLHQHLGLAVTHVSPPRHGRRCTLQQSIQGFDSFQAAFPQPIEFMVSNAAENVTFVDFITRMDQFCRGLHSNVLNHLH